MNANVDLIDLDAQGRLLHPRSRTPVPPDDIPAVLESHLRLREDTTDIFLYVHGWRTSALEAQDDAQTLFDLVESVMAQQPHAYPRIHGFRPQYVGVRWPSRSSPLPWGYRTIRDRTATMSLTGQVPRVLGAVLGYFNAHRELPEPGPDVLAGAYGQYLHCVGHSFGSRFLLHGILEATVRLAHGGPDTLSWSWRDRAYPWTLDSLTLFQAALPADSFLHRPYANILGANVLNAPVAMTFSPADTALGFWHRRTEKRQDAIGYLGATGPAEHLQELPLHEVKAPYDFPRDVRLLNVNASHRFLDGSRLTGGAHSDFYHPESAHLLLSLADAAR
ncbi:hypothetical protein SLUN_01040 [Streptomyces lunaelactis]|uniref:Alpha/beta hydrolase n=1 Tax=Streptomyces lunaelactis TaxID=1535768 RepID=A0A2R4SVZ9_9ACTN|nr:hypothetical protein [Streptomyces lunaelactis]AVZ71045.1 hypothetical protein SLUN_01040 [Streptomyces lunaelactis]NUK25455.1 hypothetical protein [Streptomyces lunaelactis]NUK87285.1 hypothetical protein [Streptomyces lunaelactis]